jgi:multiple sugar transport system substrate-binding protein
MWVRVVLLAATLALAPLSTRAADLVVWWEEGWYPEEDRAVEELVAAFEAKTGKDVELVRQRHAAQAEVAAALEAGQPPDFLWGLGGTTDHSDQWAYEDRLVELDEALGPLKGLFDADVLDYDTVLNRRTGKRALYNLPTGRNSNYVHVWKNLLERAGFTLADISTEWEPFWSFWCDQVQPAMRKALGRDDIWGIALPMSADASDTTTGLEQFLWAHTPDWPPPAGWSLVDAPAAQTVFVRQLAAYTSIYKKGCTPPDAVSWTNVDNNKAFLEQRVVMVPNPSLSIPGALRVTRPEDYRKHAVTLEWPTNAFGRPLVLIGGTSAAVVFRAGGHTALAKEFVRFLVADGWLAHWLDFSGDRLLPPMRSLIDQPFWLDPKDPHRQRAAVQILTQPHNLGWWGIPKEHERLFSTATPPIFETAVHRVVVDGLTPEQAADEAIARLKQIMSE